MQESKADDLINQKSYQVVYALAYNSYEHGRYEEALPAFRFLTVECPRERRYWVALGATYQVLRNYQEALECWGVAAVLDNSEPLAHLHAADCFFAMDKIPEALVALESAERAAAKTADGKVLLKKIKLMRETWQTKQK